MFGLMLRLRVSFHETDDFGHGIFAACLLIITVEQYTEVVPLHAAVSPLGLTVQLNVKLG